MHGRPAGYFYFLFLIRGLLLEPAVAQGQEPWQVGTSLQQGAIIRHTPKIKHFAGTYPTGLELNLQHKTSGKQAWHHIYHFPRVGLSLIYLDYHNLVIGRSLALSPYLSLPVRRFHNSQLYFRFGTGLAIFSNSFNRKSNPGNNIISTDFNAVIQTRLEYTRQLSDQFSLLGGIGLNHYSNGGNSKPNLGVNIATASLGINFGYNQSYSAIAGKVDPIKQRNYIAISSSVGLKQRNDFDTVRYIVNSIAITALRRINQKSTLLLGLEGFYDPSLFARRGWDPRVKPGTRPDIRRAALILGHELNFGRLAFGTQAGYYIYRPYKSDAAFFQRLETKVLVHKHIYIAAGLKLHDIIKADIIEYRLGLRI